MMHSTRRWSLIGLLVALCLMVSAVTVAADDQIAAAGNGGTDDCAANGGAVAIGDVNSGGNVGNVIGLGDTGGGTIGGGSVANSTDLNVAVDGGTSICDASGADDNIAFTESEILPLSGF